MIKCLSTLPTVWKTWVRSLGCEDPLKKAMATHPSILAWIIPWTEEPGRLQSMGSQRVRHDWATLLFFVQVTELLTEKIPSALPLPWSKLSVRFMLSVLQNPGEVSFYWWYKNSYRIMCIAFYEWIYCCSGCLATKSCPALFRPDGLQPARLLCPWHSPAKKTGVGCHFFRQGIFSAQ